jgi:multiple sugar transport system substrate-binding protein
MRSIWIVLAALLLASCGKSEERSGIYLQRFFGECGAVFGRSTDVGKVEGECGIITSMINKFNAENPSPGRAIPSSPRKSRRAIRPTLSPCIAA